METIDLSEALASLTTKDNLANYIGSDGKQSPQKTAEVLGGLLPVTTSEKNGLMSKDIYKNNMQTIYRLQSGQVMLIAQFTKDYEGLNIKGINSAKGEVVEVCIYRNSDGIKGKGVCSNGVTFYIDTNLNIYIKVASASLLYASIIGLSNCTLAISYASLPDDSTQIVIES